MLQKGRENLCTFLLNVCNDLKRKIKAVSIYINEEVSGEACIMGDVAFGQSMLFVYLHHACSFHYVTPENTLRFDIKLQLDLAWKIAVTQFHILFSSPEAFVLK